MNSRTLIQSADDGRTTYHKAGWIIVDPWTLIENGCVEVNNQTIVHVHKQVNNGEVIDHGPGVLMPSLVNAHLHLELSALHHQLSFEGGFSGWVQQLLEKRAALSNQALSEAAKIQAAALKKNGTLWVGDIASLNIMDSLIESLPLNGIYFREILGVHLPDQLETKKKGKSLSFAGHAPHTTSPEVLLRLKELTSKAGLPFSIHLAESDAESVFIREQSGPWASFLTQRGIDYSDWNISGQTPVAHVKNIGILDELTIAVHLLNISKTDLDLLAHTKTAVCLCPRSNLNLHGNLPDLKEMLNKGIQPALGTDSLASCDSLDIFDEMAFVCEQYMDINPEQILAMGTINGAKALGVQNITGTLEPGKKADMVYVPVMAQNRRQLLERLINNEYG